MAWVGKVASKASTVSGGADPDVWSTYESELDTWIAAVNAHTSNASQQITHLVKPSQTTSNTYLGSTIEIGHPTASSAYIGYRMSNSSTSMVTAVYRAYTPGTSNGGHGSLSDLITGATGGVFSTGYGFEGWLIHDDTEGSEYFIFTNIVGQSAQFGTALLIAKSDQGEWVVYIGPDSNVLYGTGVDSQGAWSNYAFNIGRTLLSSNRFDKRFANFTGVRYVSNPFTERVAIQPNSNRIGSCYDNNFASPIVSNDPTEDYVNIGCGIAFNFGGLV